MRSPSRCCWTKTISPGCPIFPRGCPSGCRGAGEPNKYAITLARSSVETFLQFSSRRDLREKAFQAWIRRGENAGATDNRSLIAEMVALRAERAKLLGFATFSDYRLDDQMAKTPAAARGLLDEVWGRARRKASAERDELQALIGKREATSRWLRTTGVIMRRSCARRSSISMRPRSSLISSLRR